MDVIGRQTDRSADAAFVGVRKDGHYVGPVHADRHGDPALTLGLAPRGVAKGVLVAEISLKPMSDVVAAARPEGGFAYLVDPEGRRLFDAAERAASPVRSVAVDVPGGSDWKGVVDVPAAAYDRPERNALI